MSGPYRAPQSPDKMRFVRIGAGVIAGGLFVAVIGVTYLARHPDVAAVLPWAVPPPNVSTFDHVSIEVRSGACFGPCIPRVTTIDESGLATNVDDVDVAVYGAQTRQCPVFQPIQVAPADLEKLKQLVRAVHVESMEPEYPSLITDHSTVTTVLVLDGARHTVQHPDELPPLAGEPAKRYRGVPELLAVDAEVLQVAHTDEWLTACQHTQPSEHSSSHY
jgi:hypothetical protein